MRSTPDTVPPGRNWLEIVRAQFLESPGIRLTKSQVKRLCGLDDGACLEILDALVQDNFLQLKPDGHYVRADLDGLSAARRIRSASQRHA